MLKKLDTAVAVLTLREDILLVKMKPNIDLNLEAMKNLLHQAVNLAEKKKYFAIIDTREPYDTSLEARNYYSESDYTEYRYADAFIVNSLPMRLVVNFYISFHKPKIPTKMFNNESDARKWVETLKQEIKAK